MDEPNLIRQAAGALGGTIAELAESIDMPARTIYDWSRGEREPSGPTKMLLRLIAAGKVRAEDLAR